MDCFRARRKNSNCLCAGKIHNRRRATADRMKFWPLILGTALLAGCAHFKSQPLSPEKSAAQLEARRLDDAGLKKFLEQNLGRPAADWPRTNWDLPELTLVAFYF